MPPQFLSDEIGANADTLYYTLNGQKVVQALSWEQHEGVLQQPGHFSVMTGWGDVAAGLIDEFPSGTPAQLFVGSVLQATGAVDGPTSSMPEGSGQTVVGFTGRDALAALQDSYVTGAVSVNVGTYADLVWYALQQVGLAPSGGIDPKILRTDNVANRQLKSGVPIRSILPHRTVQQILDDTGLGGPNAGQVKTVPHAKIGETWHRFIRRYLDRASLMLWAAADGSFILSAPNGNQSPTYSLVVRRGDPKQGGNVVGRDFKNDTSGRHTVCDVYGRGGGRKFGRVHVKGGFVDQEMLDLGYPLSRAIVKRDANVHSAAEADYLARRILAEERRNGYRLEYTISGLTLPYAPSAGGQRAVVVVDTVIAVNDEELGISDNFYVESLIRKRDKGTTTTIRLMRVEDLIFGGPDTEDD